MENAENDIRQILQDNGRLTVDVSKLSVEDDLVQAGLTSHATVNVLLALEEKFEVEFPTEMLRASTFASIAAIRDALASLIGTGASL